MRSIAKNLHPPRLILICAGCFALAWCLASLWFPFGWDQGIEASVGDTIVRGGMPYRDAFELKAPLSYLIYALTQLVFGRQSWGIRIVDLLVLAAGVVALYRCISREFCPILGAWAALLLIFWRASLTWFHQSQPEGWLAVMALVAISTLLGRTEAAPLRILVSSALLLGLCAAIKPIFLLLILVPITHLLYTRQNREGRDFTWEFVVLVVSVIPLTLCVIWLASRRSLSSFFEIQFGYTLNTYSTGILASLADGLQEIPTYLLSDKPSLLFLLVPLGLVTLWGRDRVTGILLSLWLGITLTVVAIQGKFFLYHWLPTFPPLIILAAAGLQSIRDALVKVDSRIGPRSAAAVLTGVFLVSLLVPAFAEGGRARGAHPRTPVAEVELWLDYVSGSLERSDFEAKFKKWGFVAGDDILAARWIEERTLESDGVAVVGNNATINYLSGRSNPSRFVFAMPLMREGAEEIRDEFRGEYIRVLKKDPPRYIVVGISHTFPGRRVRLEEFPRLKKLVSQSYRLETKIGLLRLYRKID